MPPEPLEGYTMPSTREEAAATPTKSHVATEPPRASLEAMGRRSTRREPSAENVGGILPH